MWDEARAGAEWVGAHEVIYHGCNQAERKKSRGKGWLTATHLPYGLLGITRDAACKSPRTMA